MKSNEKPDVIVTQSDGSIALPSENKHKLHKSKRSVESPNYLSTPTKPKKQSRKKTSSANNAQKEFTDGQLSEMREAFDFFDKDKRGYIPAADIGDVMRSLGQNPTNAEIRDIVRELDTDGNGKIEFEEFSALMSETIKTPEELQEELRLAFQVFDLNGDGKISVDELKTVMVSVGEGLTQEEVQEVFDMWDTNKDGEIDYREFCAAMSKESIFK